MAVARVRLRERPAFGTTKSPFGRCGRRACDEPGAWISRVSPTPLLLVVALYDKVTVADLALAAYERALEPKKLVLIPGGHFDPYQDQFELAQTAATQWFSEHLLL